MKRPVITVGSPKYWAIVFVASVPFATITYLILVLFGVPIRIGVALVQAPMLILQLSCLGLLVLAKKRYF